MIKTTHTVILLIAIVYILVVTKVLLLPFVVALLIWYLVKDIRDFIARNRFIKRRFPRWLQNTLVFVIIFGVLTFVSRLLIGSIATFADKLVIYEANVTVLNDYLQQQFNFDFIDYIQNFTGSFDFTQILQPVVNGLSQLLGDGFMIVLYVIFLLMEESTFSVKHRLLFKEEERYQQTMELVNKIDASFGNYISIKTLTSFITATLSYIVMNILGVDTPLLWAIVIFLLNYIPSIGSLIATTFPAIIAVLQEGDPWAGLWVLMGVGLIQVLVGNFLEPRMMGNSLNISPLVVILSLIAWGAIWGVLGMVLSVPIMVMLIIVCARFESTRQIAILLSENGEVN
ncbi:AI-2E family transporter [Lewinella cohaerens]|uniref:AI-2E family transporter n=1 Tax=Lewinella cohaerens TaxID=70995 RepID=UPI0003A76E84|nr:AI-2E family transporter [Lewinella cohaerens]